MGSESKCKPLAQGLEITLSCDLDAMPEICWVVKAARCIS